MGYQYLATSKEGFVQLLACNRIPNGYRHFFSGWVKPGKDPLEHDRKMIETYGCGLSRWQRADRKRKGQATAHYLRFERYWVMLFHEQGQFNMPSADLQRLRDLRHPGTAIEFDGYWISCNKGVDGEYHASVRLTMDEYRRHKELMLELSLSPDPRVTA